MFLMLIPKSFENYFIIFMLRVIMFVGLYEKLTTLTQLINKLIEFCFFTLYDTYGTKFLFFSL